MVCGFSAAPIRDDKRFAATTRCTSDQKGKVAKMVRKNSNCASCGSEIEEDASFCARCGAPIQQGDSPEEAIEGRGSYQRVPAICVSCGSEIEEDSSFCTRCGTPIQQADSPEAAIEGRGSYQRVPAICVSCGSEIEEDSSFCTRCGTPIQQGDSPEAAIEGRGSYQRVPATCVSCGSEIEEDVPFCTRCGTPVQQAAEGAERPEADPTEAAAEGRGSYQRFLTMDASGGFFATVAPALIWYGAAGVLIWSVIGLLSLRFDIGVLIDLPNLLFSMLIVVGIVVSATASYYLVRTYRERDGQLWYALSFLPVLPGALISAGLFIMILQVWTDFSWGPDDLRRAMFSLIGVGLCGIYGGYLALVVTGPERIYQVARWVVYIALAIIAAEILDAMWLSNQDLSRQELNDFMAVGGTVAIAAVVYSIIAVILAQARDSKARLAVLVTYVILGLVGFTIAFFALLQEHDEGPIALIHGGTVFVTITTIGLLVVRHFHKNRDNPNVPTGSGRLSDQPGT